MTTSWIKYPFLTLLADADSFKCDVLGVVTSNRSSLSVVCNFEYVIHEGD